MFAFEMKNLMILILMVLAANVSGQVPEKPSMLKGVGLNLTAKGGYYPQFIIRLRPSFELQGIASYAYHTPDVSHFTKTEVEGWFMGGGLAVLTRPLRSKPQDPSKSVKGSLRLGLKYMRGQMQYDAYKVFEGRSFDSYIYRDSQQKLKTDYGELSVGYEMVIKDRVKVDLIPIILGDSGVYSKSGFTLPFSAIGGHTGFPLAAGVGVSYLWR